MGQLTAHSVLPIISALPDREKRDLLRELEKMVKPEKVKKTKRKSILDQPHMEKYRPENIEMLVTEITGGR